jgi:threonine/homoserine/homoserine lactone efflux protein
MLEGIAAGFILSLGLFPGTVWLVKLGYTGAKSRVFAAAGAVALSQLVWLAVAISGVLLMTARLASLRIAMHGFAAFVLGYIAIKLMRTRRVEVLDDAGELPAVAALFHCTFNRALAMPLRLPTAMAVVLATGLTENHPSSWSTVALTLLGALVGVCGWWVQIALLSAWFVPRVPEPVTLKSLNKIRPFCGVLYGVLSLIALLLLA